MDTSNEEVPHPAVHSPTDRNISLGRPQAPFNYLNISPKVNGETALPRSRPLHPKSAAGIRSLSALAPVQAEVQKVNYKINKKRESK